MRAKKSNPLKIDRKLSDELDSTLALLDEVLSKIDPKSIPSLEEQLKNL